MVRPSTRTTSSLARGLRLAALLGGAGLFVGATPGYAQSTPAPTPTPTQTATVAPAVDPFFERPDSGAGSLVSELEYEPPTPATAAEVEAAKSYEQQLEFLAKSLEYYEKGAEDFHADQRALIRIKYQQQKDQLAQQYERRIEELETEERARRLEAIERFEAFLRKYPDDSVYTPDAMFRLAELYYEKSYDDFLRESRGYETELIAFERGERASEPRAPEQRFDKTIGLHRELLQRFPDYRLADAAQYLLGYTSGEMGRTDEALAAYQTLVERHPSSKFVPEAYTRIGEIHFDGNTRTSLEEAIAAYRAVLDFEDSPFYDKALYKVAWTHYRLDQFDASVDAFVDLVRFADAQKAETGVTGSELRAEAIQYVAISLADELWGGFNKAQAKLTPIENETFTQELWKRYGEVLFEQTRYQDAIQVLAYTTDRYPDAPGNPEAQAQIVQAYEQLRDFDGATAAREALVEQYGEGSKWAVANSEDDEAVARAASLTERSLSTAALFRHQQAQVLRSQGKAQESKSQYEAAASAYKDYLARFPNSGNAYDFNFYLAETLYYSDDYAQAASQYAMVRDSAVDNKHLEPAALFSVIALEKKIESLESSGGLPKLAVLTAAERKDQDVAPKNLPDPRKDLVQASDRFIELVPGSDNVPAIAYRAAEEFYKHDRFDEARDRFETIVARYPGEKVAEYSANLIIESYLAVEDWDKVDEWSGRLIEIAQRGEGAGARGGELVDNLEDVRLKAQFKIAERFNEAQQFEEAAEAYVKLVDANPKSEVADKALFNAAVAYERVKRFDTASQIYQRIYDDYPGSDLAPRSLFRVGINAAKGFEFEAAISAYNRLVTKYPKSDDRADALYNVAVVLEHMQRYREAADAYRRYATTFRQRPDAGEVFFRSALVYEKLKDWGSVIQTLNSFVRSYRTVPQQRERIVQARLKIGDAERSRGRLPGARNAYRDCVGEFTRLRMNVSSKAGGFAAQCAFQLAEYRFDTYDAMNLDGNERQQAQKLRRKLQAQQEVEKMYADVFRYKRLEETLAASFRIGHSYERLAESLFTAPVPKEFRRDPDLADEYKAQLEDRAAILERKAEQAYRKAHEEARRSGVTNEWTARILEGLNKF
ncbi:MAG: tetratricopeptide repeat protein, partial [Myxococcota bacterium]